MNKLTQARYLAPAIHVLLVVFTWAAYFTTDRPIMDGITAIPFGILCIADVPISLFAFGVMFTDAGVKGTAAIALWGILGTAWWFLLGKSIDAWIARIKAKRA